MATTKWKDCVIRVGTSNPPGASLAKKRDVKVKGPEQITDDTTTDDSAGPEHDVIYAGQIESMSFPLLVDRADSTYDTIRTAAEAGTKIYFAFRPFGNTSGLRECIVQATVGLDWDGSSNGMARATCTVKVTNGVTWQNIP